MSKNSHEKRAAKRKAYRPGTHASQGAANAEHDPDAGAFDIPDELLKAPKEVSKLKFGLMVLLVIFLLLIFSIPSYDIFSGAQSVENVALRWRHPDGATIEYSNRDFQREKQSFGSALEIDFFAGFPVGLGPRPKEEDLIRLMVIDRLATDAGLQVTDLQLAEHFKGVMEFNRGLTTDALRRAVANTGLTQQAFYDTIRRLLRAGRYLQLMGSAGALPDPKKIEELWHEAHEELAFDYVQVLPESLSEEARTDLPASDELEAWFNDQPESERKKLESPARRTFELALFRDVDSTAAAALVEAFPAPEGEEVDPEEQSTDYYNRVFYRRFAKPAEETEEGASPQARYYTQEEVAERLRAEAPVYFAMQRWLEDLQERKVAAAEVTEEGSEASPEIDFAAEAAAYGLELYSPARPITRDELSEEEFLTEDLGKQDLLVSAFQTPVGSFGFSTVLLENSIGVIHVTDEVAPELPPFAEIETQVADLWIKPRTKELAEEKLQAFWETLETFEPPKDEDEDELAASLPDETVHRRASEEAFRAAAEAAGFTVARRDWLDRGASSPDVDPNWQEPANRFLANQRELFDLEPDEVFPPRAARDGSATYLVRLAGKRPVPIEQMSPADYERFRTQARSQAASEVSDTLSYEYLEQQFAIELPLREEAKKREAEEAAAAEKAKATDEG